MRWRLRIPAPNAIVSETQSSSPPPAPSPADQMEPPVSGHDLRNRLLRVLIFGDTFFCFVGLSIGYWLRYVSPLRHLGIETTLATYDAYLPLIALGTIFLIGSYTYEGLYDTRYLLRPFRSLSIIIRGTFFWNLIFLGTSLVLKFEPSISRIFVALSGLVTLATMTAWRYAFSAWVHRPSIHRTVVQRILLIGWSREAGRLYRTIQRGKNQPYVIAGLLRTDVPCDVRGVPVLGVLADLPAAIKAINPAIVIVADLDLSRSDLLTVAHACERHYVEFKVIPTFFQQFSSSLRMQTISGVPVLGVENLPLGMLHNALIKRLVDIIGAIVGLIGVFPVMLYFAYRIRKEDPGPVIFRQQRVGKNGRLFWMLKLRSMKLGSEKFDHQAQSTRRNDSRMLAIGAFMRQWNLDEVPQYWNVLMGDMSLVGPRPERSFHSQQLAETIPNYNLRHTVKPGLSGWAQVNGLRGETDLSLRVQYDLYYIENWNIWFDFQIMLLTFFRRQNAY